jgi:hypothetical protein
MGKSWIEYIWIWFQVLDGGRSLDEQLDLKDLVGGKSVRGCARELVSVGDEGVAVCAAFT